MNSRPRPGDLSRLFSPRSIAIVGASENPRRIGGQPVVALTRYGYQGEVFLVNPRRPDIQGRTCHPDVTVIPRPCDVALIAVPAENVPEVLMQCGRAHIPFAIVLSAGFREVGNAELQARLEQAISGSGVRMLGPNCVGLLNLRERVFSGFGAGFRNPDLKRGPLAMVSQSGGFGYSVVAFAQEAGLGFDYVVSTGNETDIDTTEVLAHLLEQPEVEIVVSYLEGITRGEKLRALGRRALELGKPILVWKVGNTTVGREAAASHTANLTASYDFYKEVFRSGGFVEVHEMYDIVDYAYAFLQRRLPKGPAVGIITTSGGAGVLLADRCTELGLDLPPVRVSALEELKKLVPGFASLANPIDLSAQLAQDPERFNAATRAVISDPGIDQVILRSFPGTAVEEWARGLVNLVADNEKPVLISICGLRKSLGASAQLLEQARIPTYDTPGRAASAAAALRTFAAKIARYAGRSSPIHLAQRKREIPLPSGRRRLSEHESKRCLAAYGIPAVQEKLLQLAEIEALSSAPLPFPVAVKVDSPDIPHKTEAGAVRLNVDSMEELRSAAREVVDSALRSAPGATINGVLVQQMAQGLEVIVGALNDDYFGPVVVVGAGGVLTEVLGDRAMRFAPIDTATARELIEETRFSKLLDGYRGGPRLDAGALAELVSRLSQLIADHRDLIAEIDVNPVFVHAEGQGATAADALIILRR